MKNPLTKLMLRQTEITLYNIQVVFATCKFEEELAEQPVWRLLYHALYRLDHELVEPKDLRKPPAFHTPDLVDLSTPYNGKPLAKDQLVEYYLDLKARLFLYLDELNDDLLLGRPKFGAEIRLNTLMKELRRFTYEIGRINAFTALQTGKTPLFFDTDQNYPSDHQFFESK